VRLPTQETSPAAPTDPPEIRDAPELRQVLLLVIIVLFGSLALPLLNGRVFVFNDLEAFHLPFRHLYSRALAAGDSLLWTPSVLGGFYVHGEGQIGLLHPLHLALYKLLPLQVAFNLELLVNYLAACVGTFWLLRRLAFSVNASLWGAMLFAFSGFNLLHHHHLNVVAVVAHLPWLLASSDLLITADTRRQRAAGYLGVALVSASQILIGFPQAVWWNALALGTFVLLRMRETGRWRRLVPLAAGGLTGVLIGAVQLVPTIDVALRSIRAVPEPRFALSYSLHPVNLVQFWSPYVFNNRVYSAVDYPWIHEFGVYSSAIGIVALPWLWIRRAALKHRRALIVTMTAFAAVSLLLALGGYGVLDLLLVRLPVLRSLRVPARYIVLVQFSLTLLAALVFDDLRSLRSKGVRLTGRQVAVLLIPASVSVLTTALWNTRILQAESFSLTWVSEAAEGTALIAVTTALVWLAAQRVVWALPLLVAVTALDLGWWGLRYVWGMPPRTIDSLMTNIPSAPPDPGLRSAFVEDPSLEGNMVVLANYRVPAGYVGLFPATALAFDDPITLQLAGTRWRFSPGRQRHGVPDSVARARLLDDVRLSGDPARDLRTIDPLRTALVVQPIPPLAGPPGLAKVGVDRPGHIVAATSAPGRQLLSIAERYHPGWSALVDGRPAEVLAVNGDFLGCVVEAGDHRVELRFWPASFVRGAWLSIAGLILLVAGAIFVGRYR
jgi:hypothetical protein